MVFSNGTASLITGCPTKMCQTKVSMASRGVDGRENKNTSTVDIFVRQTTCQHLSKVSGQS